MGGEAVKGMSAVITVLKANLTADVFFGVIEECIPFLAVMVPVSLGYRFLRKMIKGAGRAKVSC